MSPLSPEMIGQMLLLLPVFLLSLTVHEYAHARTALAFGDPTAKNMGRVSFNPLRHLDLVGTLVLVLTRMIGWAKPVPVNPNNLHPRRLGDIVVSVAGPLSNFGIAVVAGLLLKVLLAMEIAPDTAFLKALYTMLLYTMIANFALMLFNMLPLFPLDGHHVARELLPGNLQGEFMHWQMRYGRIILAVVILGPGLAEMVLNKPVFDPIGFARGHLMGQAIRLMGLEKLHEYFWL